MSQAYNRDYIPPFPQLSIVLDNNDEQLGPLMALVDTGADITFVPTHLLEKVEAIESAQAQIRSHFGALQPVQLYLTGIQVAGLHLVGLYVVGDDQGEDVILGRDVLNKLPVFLDGLKAYTDVLNEAQVERLRRQRK